MAYHLLERQQLSPRTPIAVLDRPTLAQVQQLLTEAKRGNLWALDIETRGVSPHDSACAIIGVGFADQDGCFYIDLRAANDTVRAYVKQYIRDVQLTAFNAKFEAGFLKVWTGDWLNWAGCSYGLFRYLTTEGFDGQEWSLEVAQRDVLGWMESNKTAFDAVLAAHGLTKETMWQLSADKIGPYCAGDADAAWQLWCVLVARCEELGFDQLLAFHRREFLTEVELFVEQQLRGMAGDYNQMETYHGQYLLNRIEQTMHSFLEHPLVAPHVSRFNTEVHNAWKRAEPPKTVKDGSPSKRWEQWRDREHPWMEERRFNPNSKQQLATLFYEQIFRVVRETRSKVFVEVNGKTYEVEKTDSGRRSVKKQILPLFGEPGALLMAYNKLVKEAGYVRAALAMLDGNDTIHPEINIVGTLTGRPAGGDNADDD